MGFDLIFVAAAILLVLSVVASKISDRFGIPAMLLFLIVGMLAGSDGPGGIYFDDPNLAQVIGAAALMVILFSGGLSTQWKAVRPILAEGITLATVGVLLTALLLGTFTHYILGVSWQEGFLLGAIVSSTDAAAVFSILRSKGVHLAGKLKPLLELESGSNDPMAVFLTIAIISLLQNPDQSVLSLIPLFFKQMLIGGVIGILAGWLTLFLLNRFRLGYEGLYPVLTVGILILTFSGTNLLGGSGFLAVYLTGLVMGSQEFLHKRSLVRFYDGTSWLMQITMFLVLGLLVFPSRLLPIALPALAITLFLMLVARPVSVFLATLPFRIPLREKTFIAWVGLRGAVPIVLAIYPRIANLPQSDLIFNVVFFVVLASVLLQGTSVPFAARMLKVEALESSEATYPIEFVPEHGWQGNMQDIIIPPESCAIGRAIFELHLPPSYLIVLIHRSGEYLVPNGGMVLQAGDRILGISAPEVQEQVADMFCQPNLPS